MNITIIVITIVGILAIGGLIGFLYYRKKILKPISSKLKNINPDSSDSTSNVENFDSEWRRLGIDLIIIKNIEKNTNQKMLPSRLEEITRSVNYNLHLEGFEFTVTPAQVLDVLAARDHLAKVGKNINMLEAVVSLWLDQYIRKQSKERSDQEEILPHEEISPEYLKKYYDALLERAKKNKEARKSANQSNTGTSIKGSPVTANSVEGLVKKEAEFHTRRILNIPHGNPIGPEHEKVFKEQWNIAVENCRKKGYQI